MLKEPECITLDSSDNESDGESDESTASSRHFDAEEYRILQCRERFRPPIDDYGSDESQEKADNFVRYSDDEDIPNGAIKLKRGWLRPQIIAPQPDGEVAGPSRSLTNLTTPCNGEVVGPSNTVYKYTSFSTRDDEILEIEINSTIDSQPSLVSPATCVKCPEDIAAILHTFPTLDVDDLNDGMDHIITAIDERQIQLVTDRIDTEKSRKVNNKNNLISCDISKYEVILSRLDSTEICLPQNRVVEVPLFKAYFPYSCLNLVDNDSNLSDFNYGPPAYVTKSQLINQHNIMHRSREVETLDYLRIGVYNPPNISSFECRGIIVYNTKDAQLIKIPDHKLHNFIQILVRHMHEIARSKILQDFDRTLHPVTKAILNKVANLQLCEVIISNSDGPKRLEETLERRGRYIRELKELKAKRDAITASHYDSLRIIEFNEGTDPVIAMVNGQLFTRMDSQNN